MARYTKSIDLYHAFAVLWMVVFISISFMMVWALIYQQESVDRKRPGINIKEL